MGFPIIHENSSQPTSCFQLSLHCTPRSPTLHERSEVMKLPDPQPQQRVPTKQRAGMVFHFNLKGMDRFVFFANVMFLTLKSSKLRGEFSVNWSCLPRPSHRCSIWFEICGTHPGQHLKLVAQLGWCSQDEDGTLSQGNLIPACQSQRVEKIHSHPNTNPNPWISTQFRELQGLGQFS